MAGRKDSMNASTNHPINTKKVSLNQQVTVERTHVTEKDLATYCMVSPATIRRWIKEGKIASIKLPSNQYRVSMEDFEKFLKRYNMPIKTDLILQYKFH
jgi:excisionase family DNA binding protein